MDGVLWRGDEPLPGMVDFLNMLRARGIPFVLATNNSSKTPANYVAKLAKLGVPDVSETQVITSGMATAAYLQERTPAGTRVYVVGGDGLREIMRGAGFTVCDTDVDFVVAGMDPDLTYEKLKRGALLIRAGATFIGTNADRTFPTPEGLVPGAGSVLAALETATDQQPTIIGKPYDPMFRTALHTLGTLPDDTLMIGDRLNTDIAGALHMGLPTLLVLSGVTRREELETGDIQPDWVYENLAALLADWG
ncbi:MAG: HAD family hydrolase [Anaerolineaceae bacterium]|nr:HAD family hydrolase [Anaerolineaceae bacterium]